MFITSLVNKKIGSFAFYFFILVVIAKIIYLVFESQYNFNILSAVADFETLTDKDKLQEIERTGHSLSSIGLTLLILPLAYLLLRKFFYNELVIFFLTIIISIFSYFIFHKTLTTTMDTIVEKNSDKRFEAYYTNVLKYGILLEKFGYEKFLAKDIDLSKDVGSQVLIANLFVLSFIDKEIVDRVRLEGADALIDIYVQNIEYDQYNKTKNEFIESAEQIKLAWDKYTIEKKNINKELDKRTERGYVESEYHKFRDAINKKFDDYINAKIELSKKRDNELSKIPEYEEKLKKYFRYQGNSRAENEYRTYMNESLGRYIQPQEWCSGSTCPNRYKIKQIIEREIESQWNKKVGLPKNLDNQYAFLTNEKVKKSVIKELRAKGLQVSDSFNYSKKQFIKAYENSIRRELSSTKVKFQKEFERKTGIKNIPFNLGWSEFVKKFEPQFTAKFKSKKYAQKAIKLIINGNLNKFYVEIYKPYIYDTYVKDIIYDEQDFSTNQTAIERGNNAIKALYIPPFALAMSIIAGVLNLLSVITMLLLIPLENSSVRNKKVIKFLFKTSTAVVVFMFLYINGNKNDYVNKNVAIQQINFDEHPILEYYIKSLNSLIYLEELNSKFY